MLNNIIAELEKWVIYVDDTYEKENYNTILNILYTERERYIKLYNNDEEKACDEFITNKILNDLYTLSNSYLINLGFNSRKVNSFNKIINNLFMIFNELKKEMN